MYRKNLLIIIGVIGLGCLFLAVFAQQLGVGHDEAWGPGRIIVAIAGLSLLCITALVLSWKCVLDGLNYFSSSIRRLGTVLVGLPIIQRGLQNARQQTSNWRSSWEKSPTRRWAENSIIRPLDDFSGRLRQTRAVAWITQSPDHKADFVIFLLSLVILAVYVWFISVGYWTAWPKTGNYFDRLAQAFEKGQVSLLEEPESNLLNLANPYVYKNRVNVDYPWDAILYNGKFYFYWGPAPALIIMLAHLFYPHEVGDHVMVFGFACGVFVFSSLLISRMRKRLFPNLGWEYIIPAVLMAGLASMMPWLLNRPNVYETAISGGQFFLISGLFFCFLALGKSNPNPWWLGVASGFLGLSVASRASLAFAASFLILLVIWRVFGVSGFTRRTFPLLIAATTPFALTAIGMGLYNFIRFGSWFEFGIQYMLTGMDLHANTFSLANVPINLHNFLINPFRTLQVFPYIKPELGGRFIFFPISSPANYYSEHVTGLLLTVPFILFTGIPIVYLARYAWGLIAGRIGNFPFRDDRFGDDFFRWTALVLMGTTLLTFVPILLFIAGNMRYLADVVPLLVLLSTFGLFMGRQYLEGKSTSVFWFNLLVVVLTVYSITVSLLLAVTGAEARFEHLNPILFDKLTRWFTP
jgi:hypothetical protein